MPRSSEVSLPFGFSNQYFVRAYHKPVAPTLYLLVLFRVMTDFWNLASFQVLSTADF